MPYSAREISDWFVASAFLCDSQAFDSLQSACGEHILAEGFFVRFLLRRNAFGIAIDINRAKGVARDIYPAIVAIAENSDISCEDQALTCATSLYLLGYFHAEGLLSSNERPDIEQALVYFEKSAMFAYAPAINHLGLCYAGGGYFERIKDTHRAAELYRIAAAAGFAPAQHNLGMCYLKGEGVPLDNDKALMWLKSSSSQGFAPAEVNLGCIFDEGRIVVENKCEAVNLYRSAAEKGNTSAQFNLALCYEFGHGVERDVNTALRWYRLGAEGGHQKCCAKVSSFEAQLHGEKCPICWEHVDPHTKEAKLITPTCCGKPFHRDCFYKAQRCATRANSDKCPHCRQTVPTTIASRMNLLSLLN